MREEALLWFKQARKALNDLRTEDWDSAAFWSQQASEKALKTLLIAHGKMHRIHNLLELREIVKRELTIHYTMSRYPNAANTLPSQPYDESKAKDLIGRAEKILGWVERNLR